jgi:hypothetical protein
MSGTVRLDVTGTVEIEVFIGQDHFWEVIKKLSKENGTFTHADVAGLSSGGAGTAVSTYLLKLRKCGVIEKVGMATYKAAVYRLVRMQRFPPVLRDDGTLGKLNLVQDHIWRAIKRVRAFTIRELCSLASTDKVTVKEQTARGYIRHLEVAGYLRRHDDAAKRDRFTVFSLKAGMDTGPRAPVLVAAHIVFDRNLRQVMTKRATAQEMRP